MDPLADVKKAASDFNAGVRADLDKTGMTPLARPAAGAEPPAAPPVPPEAATPAVAPAPAIVPDPPPVPPAPVAAGEAKP
jgi:hypothetical protein